MRRPGVRMTYEGFSLRMPDRGVNSLTDRVTAEKDLFVVTHMGLAEIDTESWFLDVGGLVRDRLRLTLADLDGFQQHDVMSVHECAGSPLAPTEPKRRVGNVVWTGVRLSDVLDRATPQPDADFVWSEGLEWGAFAGLQGEPFVKDLPLAKARGEEVLLAMAMNGTALRPERGGPVRLVVPGWYGTNSVKWLGSICLAKGRAPGPFTTRFYNDMTPNGPLPVWGVAPESIIVKPSTDDRLLAQQTVSIEGWAWAEVGVVRVEVSADDGMTWREAVLEKQSGFAWQGFKLEWRPEAGQYQILCRCTDMHGVQQPYSGARNAIHKVQVTVS